MTFGQQLTIILIDKLVIGVIVLIAGLWLNRKLEAFKSRQTQSLEIAREKRQVLEKQLSEFYRPILLRLERDNVIWRYVLDKYKADESTQKFGLSFEKTFILRNHDQIMEIIETRGHLIGGDKQVLEVVNIRSMWRSIKLCMRWATLETPIISMRNFGFPTVSTK